MKEILRQISDFLRGGFLVLLVLASAALGIYRLVKLQIVAAEEENQQHIVENVCNGVLHIPACETFLLL